MNLGSLASTVEPAASHTGAAALRLIRARVANNPVALVASVPRRECCCDVRWPARSGSSISRRD